MGEFIPEEWSEQETRDFYAKREAALEKRKAAMTDTALVPASSASIVEQVVIKGNLADLTPRERVNYYTETCKSLGLNPLTTPFQYITLNNKLTLYATKAATDQLRQVHHVAITSLVRDRQDDLYTVTATAQLPDGRTDEAIGAVSIKGLAGDFLANAVMKAETKAKRRVTLSIVGLGWLDESELDTTPGTTAHVDQETGEIDEGKREYNFRELEEQYRRTVEAADKVGVPAENFDPGWPPEEIIAKGKKLSDAIRAKRGK